jgi:AcrR family transcriptional regulator
LEILVTAAERNRSISAGSNLWEPARPEQHDSSRPPERLDPRIIQTRNRVFAATLEIIAENGVQQATVDRIAERSGVGRSTIYRRWDSLPQLYLEAFAQIVRRTTEHPRGDTETELLHYLEDYADRLSDPTYCSVLVALLDAAWRDPEIASIRERVVGGRTSRAAAILEAGISAGRIRPDIDLRDALEAIIAPFFFRRIVEQEAISRSDVERVHRTVLERFGTTSKPADADVTKPEVDPHPRERKRRSSSR